MTQRGISLAMVLMCAGLALTAAFTVGAITTHHLQLVRQRDNTQDARLLADEAVAEGMSRLRANPAWGQSRTDGVTVAPDPDRQAVISFQRQGTWYSTNNGMGQDGQGWNGPVSAGTVELVAVANCHGVQRVIDAIVTAPLFPYVLAVDGSLEVDTALQAGSPGAMPGNVASNTSMSIQGPCVITGDVLCSQPVRFPLGSTIGGTIRQGRVSIPDLPLDRFDVRTDPHARPLTPAGPDPQLPSQHLYSNTGLRLNSLTLDGTMLYVNGDLTVTGSVSGHGTLVVAGNTRIGGRIELSTTDMVALIGDGDVTLTGPPGTARFFQGLVYTRGTFSASNVTIVGCFLAKAGAAGSPGMRLDNVTAIFNPAAVTLTAATGIAQDLAGQLSSGDVAAQAQPLPFNPGALNLPPGGMFVGSLGNSVLAGTPPSVVPPLGPLLPTSSLLVSRVANTITNPWLASIVQHNPATGQPTGITVSQFALPQDPTTVLTVWSMALDPMAQQFVDVPPTVFTLKVDPNTYQTTVLPVDTFLQGAASEGIDGQAIVSGLLQAQQTATRLANQMLASDLAANGPAVNLGLNQFFPNGPPLSTLSWREMSQ